jgi:hypothetical protein
MTRFTVAGLEAKASKLGAPPKRGIAIAGALVALPSRTRVSTLVGSVKFAAA